MTQAVLKPIDEMTFESALSELEEIVRSLETGRGDLETSIEGYERGIALKKLCENKLKDAQAKIEKITMNETGAVKTETFNVDNE